MDNVPSQPKENQPEKIYTGGVEFWVQTQASFITSEMEDEESPTMAAVEKLESELTTYLEAGGYSVQSLSYHFEEDDLLGVWETDDKDINNYDFRASVSIELASSFTEADVVEDSSDVSIVPTEDALNMFVKKLEEYLSSCYPISSVEVTRIMSDLEEE